MPQMRVYSGSLLCIENSNSKFRVHLVVDVVHLRQLAQRDRVEQDLPADVALEVADELAPMLALRLRVMLSPRPAVVAKRDANGELLSGR